MSKHSNKYIRRKIFGELEKKYNERLRNIREREMKRESRRKERDFKEFQTR